MHQLHACICPALAAPAHCTFAPHVVSVYHSLQFVMEPNNKLVVLGEGSHAVVLLARLSGMAVAVKVGANCL